MLYKYKVLSVSRDFLHNYKTIDFFDSMNFWVSLGQVAKFGRLNCTLFSNDKQARKVMTKADFLIHLAFPKIWKRVNIFWNSELLSKNDT